MHIWWGYLVVYSALGKCVSDWVEHIWAFLSAFFFDVLKKDCQLGPFSSPLSSRQCVFQFNVLENLGAVHWLSAVCRSHPRSNMCPLNGKEAEKLYQTVDVPFQTSFGFEALMVVNGVKIIYMPIMAPHRKRLPQTWVSISLLLWLPRYITVMVDWVLQKPVIFVAVALNLEWLDCLFIGFPACITNSINWSN